MKAMKFSMAMFVVVSVSFLTSHDLQAKEAQGFGEECNEQSDCEKSNFMKGLICGPDTPAKDSNKICKYGENITCESDTDCALNLICKGRKDKNYYCMPGCISEANCKKDEVCRGYYFGMACNPTVFGKCYTKDEKGKEGTKCVHVNDCNKGLACTAGMKKNDNGHEYKTDDSRCPSGICIEGTYCGPDRICSEGYKSVRERLILRFWRFCPRGPT